MDEVSRLITQGLGGKKNISDVDCCATRLRITVYDAGKVDEGALKSSGAAGVIRKGQGVQVIYGPKVTVIKSNLEDYLQSAASDVETPTAAATEENPADTAGERKKNPGQKCRVLAPMEGTLMPLAAVEDGIFSAEMLGKGAAIEPETGKVRAPFDGEVSMVFDTKHAIGLVGPEGVELLIHVGIDTVQLNGKYYDVHVKNGDKVKAGDLLAEVDLEGIRAEGYRTVTPVIVTNSDIFDDIQMKDKQKVGCQDTILEIK